MDLHQLKIFLAVLRVRRFSLAAREANLTQQAVSKSIANLEAELGVRLFDRTTAGAMPTPFAKGLEVRAKTMVAEARLAIADIAALKGDAFEEVRVGFSLPIFETVLPAAVKRLRQRRPNANFALIMSRTPDLLELLMQNEIGAALCMPRYDGLTNLHPDLQEEPIHQHDNVVAARASHPLAGTRAVDLNEAARYPWIVPYSHRPYWGYLHHIYAEKGLPPPRELIRTTSPGLLRALILSDDFLCMIDREQFAIEASHLPVTQILLGDVVQSYTSSIVYRKGATPSPTLWSFIEALKSAHVDFLANPVSD